MTVKYYCPHCGRMIYKLIINPKDKCEAYINRTELVSPMSILKEINYKCPFCKRRINPEEWDCEKIQIR